MRKEFHITERVKARFEAQSFNLMNHPNFRGLNVTTTGSAFNTVSSAGPARNIQFGLKVNFWCRPQNGGSNFAAFAKLRACPRLAL